MKSETSRISHEQQTMKEKIKVKLRPVPVMFMDNTCDVCTIHVHVPSIGELREDQGLQSVALFGIQRGRSEFYDKNSRNYVYTDVWYMYS